MPQNTKKPQLRFKGFADNWEQRKLGEIATTYSGGTPSVAIKKYYIGNIPFIRSSEVNSTSTELFINEEALHNSSAKMVSIGDILYALYGATSGEVGRSALNGAINQAILAILPKKEYDSEFLMHWLRKSKIEIISTYLQGGQGNLSADIVKNLNIDFPIHKEQIIIGTLLKSIDNLIILHQRKLDKLKNVKKSMLEKMFPKNGSNVPEIRFKGFTDAWEQRNTKELCSISTGKSNTQDRVEDGKYPFYVRSSIVERSNRYLFDEEAVLTVGDGVGTGKVFHYVNGKYDLHQRVYRMFNFSEEISAKYFFYYFSNHFYNRVMAMTAKTSVDSVRYEMISEMEIYLPNKQEQNIVAMYFESLDSLITLHQRKLEKLQNIKKACLEKMFV